MTLEDFFTLTEMNNGLIAPSRVRELMAAMHKERDIVKNSSDSMRQYSAVASVLAATKNKDCLDLFIQFDGLHFISGWLKDAHKLSDDPIDRFVEESITHLLRALEKLQVDYEKLVVSEIWTAVEDLLVHNSSKVKDKARVLFESWKTKRDSDSSHSDGEAAKGADIEHLESSLIDGSVPETSDKEKGQQLTKDDKLLSISPDNVQPSQIASPNNLEKILDSRIEDERILDHSSSLSHSISTIVETCSPAVSPKTENFPEKLSSLEESTMSESRSSTCAVDEMKPVSSLAGEGNSCDKVDSRIIDSIGKGRELNHSLLSKSSDNDKIWGQSKDLGKFLSGIEDHGKANAFRMNLSNNSLANIYNFGKKQLDREPDRAGTKSDVEIDYGIVDPLEVARQVAMEVEREVDNRERSCSSAKLPEGNVQQPNSPYSVTRKQSHESSPILEESGKSSGLESDDNGAQDMATSEVADAAAQEEAKSEKSGFCDFDLNQEAFSEESADRQFSTPVSVVSASRAAAASGLPIAPLQFEGNLGWKGSAATSAFRPASPRRMPETERLGFLDFDLNVAESGDAARTGESSVETNSRKSGHLELDLNLATQDGGAPLVSQFFPILKSHHSSSHSSSSTKQQLGKNFDLNDQPSFVNEFPKNSSYSSKLSQNFNPSGCMKSDDSVISKMGKQVEVNQKDFVSQIPHGNLLPYVNNSSVYNYNNIVGPTMPFSSTIYGSAGPIPYMMDSKGVPVIPQIVGSAFSQPPFVINMNSSNGFGPSSGGFDVNSGMFLESGSKDPSGFGLFLRSNSQSNISSAAGGKRKEPDNRWENHPFRHYASPWK